MQLFEGRAFVWHEVGRCMHGSAPPFGVAVFPTSIIPTCAHAFSCWANEDSACFVCLGGGFLCALFHTARASLTHDLALGALLHSLSSFALSLSLSLSVRFSHIHRSPHHKPLVDGSSSRPPLCFPLPRQIPRLVYTSSPSVVIAGDDIENGDESMPYPPKYLDNYTITKSLAEQEVLKSNGMNDKLATCALRPHAMFGPRDNHFFPQLIEVGCLKNGSCGFVRAREEGKRMTKKFDTCIQREIAASGTCTCVCVCF